MWSVARLLRIADLRAACDKLLNAAEARFGSELDLDSLPVTVAEYWEFDPATAYEVRHPAQHVAGSVTDDLEEVQDLLQRPQDEVYLWHDLDHLTGLLRMLAFLDLPRSGA